MVKLILTHEVTGLGAAGDVVEVKDGYARNYLVPRGLATRWTKGGQKQVDQIQAARRSRAIATIEEARDVRDRLQANPVTVAVRAGENGRLFGAVTTTDIAEAVQAAGGPKLDRRKIEVPRPIKALGTHKVHVRLHEDVQATLDVTVVPAK
ncbi:50S ribosomal protein L9 [Georgenia thermotolerans]|uniref:Large ribosomal subunit protein bL9 n=1 Tax=Georgenia thermotolerans TaxID=527326 RepID=A0A7J5UTW5_9MICO|nr:50S ribosomal protein L9 [Georgenia thermotolerans]KAE8765723.1 50S ribosomal protein L9 [Georgenia thermotolerans]